MSTSNLKISIAALSLCVSAVAIYIHLPYVIAAVSGSGAIEVVPLAIFTVSAIVALVSVICLIRLAVSRAGDKKKIDLSGEESGNTASQEPQEKPVKQDSESQIKVDSGTSLQDKSSVSTSPSQSPQTCNSIPPPPPPPPSGAAGKKPPVIEVDSGTSSQDKSSVSTSPSQSPQTCNSIPPPPPPPSGAAGKKPPVIEVDSGTSSQDKSSVSTSPLQSPQTRDTAVPHVSQEKPVKQDSESQTDVERVIPQNNNASSPSLSGVPPPPLPPGGLKNWNPPKNNTTGEKSPVGTTQKNTSSCKKYEPPKDSNQVPANLDDILKVRENLKRLEPKNSICGQQGAGGSMDELLTALKERRKGVIGNEKSDEQQSNKLEGAYSKMSAMIPPPRSRSSSVLSDSGNVPDDEDWDTDPEPIEQASSGSPSSKEERSKSPDSGIESRATSPSYSEQKTEESPSAAQVNNVDPVNSGVQNSPITETPVDTKEQNNSGSAGSYTNEKDNELGLDSDAENESKERAARIEREQAERREKQEKVNSDTNSHCCPVK